MKIIKNKKLILACLTSIILLLAGFILVYKFIDRTHNKSQITAKILSAAKQATKRERGQTFSDNAGGLPSDLPKEIPIDPPIPLLWTDNNQGENLIIQSDRRYYDGSTYSIVYFAITNLSGKRQNMKVKFEFKTGVGKLSEVEKINPPSTTFVPKVVLGNSFSDILTENETNFYKAKIEYPKGAKGEFIIIAKGDNNGYGKLDPYFTSGLVGYWSFNGQDINGTTAYDRSGNNNNGTIHGATPTIGKQGQALSFDGVDDYVDCGSADAIRINHLGNKVTIEAWIFWKGGTSGLSRIGGFQGYFGDYALWVSESNDKVLFEVDGQNGNQLYSTQTISHNQWHHIVGTFDSSGMRIYIDGVLAGEATDIYYPPTEGTANLRFGYKENEYFHGLIDEVRIYNRALSAEEIAEHYRVGARRFKIDPTKTEKMIIK